MPALTEFIMIIYVFLIYLAFGSSDILKKTIFIREVRLGRQQGDYLSQISAGGMFIWRQLLFYRDFSDIGEEYS